MIFLRIREDKRMLLSVMRIRSSCRALGTFIPNTPSIFGRRSLTRPSSVTVVYSVVSSKQTSRPSETSFKYKAY